jgi:dihydrofolate reductase
MRRVRYGVAASIDGFIAGPNGEYDWIPNDPEIDFHAIFAQFDTALIGRRTFDVMTGGKKKASGLPGMKTFVFSRTLRQRDYPKVTIVTDNAEQVVKRLRAEPGKDIWLFGGGELFGSLLDVGLVDAVDVAIIPVLLGEGIPLLPPPYRNVKLKLTKHKIYRSGIISVQYAVQAAKRKKTSTRSR